MDLIQHGIDQKLISLSEDNKTIIYCFQNKKRNYQNPEEQVQAETFLKLILEYGYPVKHIRQYETITVGSSNREADIIVYNDDECKSPYIIVECKRQEVTQAEFNQAIEQAFSYSGVYPTAKYVWVTSKLLNAYFEYIKDKPKERQTNILTDIPHFNSNFIPHYKYVYEPTDLRFTDLKQITETELKRIFKQSHDALWAGGQLNPSQAFDELDKLIFCKIWDEKNTSPNQPYKFQIYKQDSLEKLQQRILSLYEEGKKKDASVFDKPIGLSADRIKTVVGYFESINLSETDLDSKGAAFEAFLGAYFRGDFGQFFTPRNVVKFIIEVLPITNAHRVLDTSCGSGGFLLYALDKVRKQASSLFPNYKTNHQKKWFAAWHDFAQFRLFGIEISEQIARVAKMNMILHDDGHTNVINVDGLLFIDEIQKYNKEFQANSFDFIVTNPPFGSVLKQTERAYLRIDTSIKPYYDFALKEINWIDRQLKAKHVTTGRESQSTEVLFIEQCHKFLRPNGYLAIVIPDGILTNSSLQYVRDGIEEKFRIVAVISLPQTAFMNTGAGVKSSVLFLRKYAPEVTESIRAKKADLQFNLAHQHDLIRTVARLENEKKAKLKPLVLRYEKAKKKANTEALIADESVEELKQQDELIRQQREAISQEYNERLNELYDRLEEQYQQAKQQQLGNYPIFMAIAENIGFDATGRIIPQNDLIAIGEELQRFIAAIDAGTDVGFFLSLFVNKSKVFLIQRSEIENRLDANTYHPERINVIRKLQATNWQLKALKFIANFSKNIVSTNSNNLPYVGLENIECNTGVYIETMEKESFGSAMTFKKNQVLFPKLRPYLNKVYLADFDGLCSTEFHILDSRVVPPEKIQQNQHYLRSSLLREVYLCY